MIGVWYTALRISLMAPRVIPKASAAAWMLSVSFNGCPRGNVDKPRSTITKSAPSSESGCWETLWGTVDMYTGVQRV